MNGSRGKGRESYNWMEWMRFLKKNRSKMFKEDKAEYESYNQWVVMVEARLVCKNRK